MGIENIKILGSAPFLDYFRSLLYTSLNASVLMETHTAIVLFALVAALGLVTVVAVNVMLTAQEAEAGCERGAGVNKSLEKSSGKCFDRGTF
jgi:hypothetical protein